tara:strand:- start:669 stop:806 length:138 start_codon:yes stop_codon:yes gene_type:complete
MTQKEAKVLYALTLAEEYFASRSNASKKMRYILGELQDAIREVKA